MRILLADDDQVSLVWLAHLLQSWDYEVETVNNGLKAFSALSRQDGPMVAIIDWMMPGLDGIEICQRIKKDPRFRFHYLIMLTGKSDTDDIVRALQSGADDFIIKPFIREELQVRLRAGARIIELQQELLEKASHDELTTILNRRMLIDMAGRELERAWRSNAPLALLMLDLDFFKKINDTYGHLVGDAVLIEVAQRFKSGLRALDIFGRYGGEEFMVLLPGCDVNFARIVADHLRLLVSEKTIDFQGQSLSISVSIGIAVATFNNKALNNKITLVDLIGQADHALYQAKRAGRNCIVVFDGA
jgi:diguanylate cyclase (GGDEF)-like protein